MSIMPYGYPPPSYPQHYPMDPPTFRRNFSHHLAELTINSRPIIQSLSMEAHDNVRFADIVAQCLETHIREVPPWMKLPGLYLLDMISKNIFEPYARLFAAFIVPLFLEVYAGVDEPTRGKMEELVLTWRTGSPTGRELFGVPAQHSIERGIWGDAKTGKNSRSGPSHISKAQVLRELQFTLDQKERALAANPYDSESREHIGILHKLREYVERGVSQDDLRSINNQLRSLMRNAATPVPPQPPPPPPPVVPQWSVPQSYPPAVPLPLPSHLSHNVPPPVDAFSSYPVTSVPVSIPPPAPIVTPAPIDPPAPNLTHLLSTLVKAGLVPPNATDATATAAPTEPKDDDEATAKLEREATDAYRQAVLAENVVFTSAEITRRRPRIGHYLYDSLSLQCKQCGLRFQNPTGKKAMDDHLDMHFRQNRKASQNIGRGHSRSWSVGLSDWVHDSSDNSGNETHRQTNPKKLAEEERAKREAELRAQFVVIPPGDEAKTISCPVCKESLKPEFLEEDEEWVWKNAVQKEDRIFHATCHAEASTNIMATRLRNELVSGNSRSATPEVKGQTTTPPSRMRSLSPSSQLAGTKRKVEHPHSSETDATPSKKLAIA